MDAGDVMKVEECPQCGASREPGATYCGTCGQSLPTPPRRGLRRIAWWLSLLVPVIAALLFVAGWAVQSNFVVAAFYGLTTLALFAAPAFWSGWLRGRRDNE
jgi:hypothetical protein